MSLVILTGEQITASTSRERRLFIEANPGSGKTTVAAERYGVLRFNLNRNSCDSIMAVSFTRSATSELHRRIRRRWGSKALIWPHRVNTIDGLICDIVHHMLRCKAIRWPNDHTTIEILDDWHGHNGYRWLEAGKSYRRIATLDDNSRLISVGQQVIEGQFGFGNKDRFHNQLELGRCTHKDMRDILAASLQKDGLKLKVMEYLSSTITHLIVDEIFDANRLDLKLVTLCCDVDIDMTIIGDPWQALYGFRGAKPDLVPQVVDHGNFTSLSLSHSFRFQSTEMKRFSTLLRCSQPVNIGSGGPYEVALASKWETLWTSFDHILPLSFGRTGNKTDAATTLLLDYLIQLKFSDHAIFLYEALIILGINHMTYHQEGQQQMSELYETLTGEDHNTLEQALDDLRSTIKTLGASSRPRRSNREQRHIERLGWLKQRLSTQHTLVPGMTIHQAKGREWDHVGVRLSSAEISKLASGLNKADESDRALYVALTRARKSVTLL